MRCPQCAKMVSFGEAEIEWEEEPELGLEVSEGESDPDGSVVFAVKATISAEAHITRTCGECTEGLAEAYLSDEKAIEHDCEAAGDDPRGVDDEDSWEVQADDPTVTEESRRKMGKKGLPTGYPTTYVGFECAVTLTCPRCAEKLEVTLSAEERASGFESLE